MKSSDIYIGAISQEMPQPSICLKITYLKFHSNFPGANELTHYPLVAPCGERHLRLLHSPSLVAIGLSVGYETWPPIGWHLPFVIGWSKDRLGLPSAPLHYGLKWPVGFPTAIQTSVTVLLHCPNGNCLLLGLCKGTVKESTDILINTGSGYGLVPDGTKP